MTPKEKAKELFDKYKGLPWGNTHFTRIERQRQCALICVEEILKGDHLIRTPLSFWEQVKEEIEKL